MMRGLHYAVDRANRRITTDWHGHFVSQSTYHRSYDCALPWQTPAENTPRAARDMTGSPEISASPTLDAPCGAGFWSNVVASRDTESRIDALPPDAYFASGMKGQRIVIVPSNRLSWCD